MHRHPVKRMSYLARIGRCVARWVAVGVLWALGAAGAASVANADGGSGCVVSVGKDGVGEAHVRDAFKLLPEIEAKLKKGVSVTVVHEVMRPGQSDYVFGCKAFYDLWDEAYAVTTYAGRMDQPAGPSHTVHTLPEVQRLCLDAALPGHMEAKGSASVSTYLDPVSDEQRQKTRQWLAEKGIGNGTGALFGRAAYAITNMDQKKATTRDCPVELERRAP
jgi:hypothetical protein